mgnify:CR=1 FL=1
MTKIHDLRSALEFLETVPGQLLTSDTEVDPNAEVSGVYRHVGAGGTVARPTKEGPAMLFNNVKGFPDARVTIGMLASRKRVGMLLGTDPEFLGKYMGEKLKETIPPVMIPEGKHIDCQEVVHYATDPDFDLRTLVPAPTNTPEDAGPYITMGLCMGTDPENGTSDVTIHRLCIESRDELGMWITPGSRHLGAFFDKYCAQGKDMPISISIGLDPAVYMCAGFEAPTTPLGYNELQIAGALRGEAVELANCLTIPEKCIANAEYVLEGYLCHDKTVREDINSNTGKAMPEFPGYTGDAKPALPVIKITAVTHRKNPIMQFKKSSKNDEGRQRNAALLAFSAFSELKHVFLVDEDVDIFDMSDVMWAMTTRFQADVDMISIPGCHCHVLDPSNDHALDPSIRVHGIACKAIFDCTVPFDQKENFVRSRFMEIDKDKWAKELAF